MQHINWHADVRAVNHRPAPDQRVFVDATVEHVKETTKKRIDDYWERNVHNCHEQFGTKEKMFNCLYSDPKDGEPMSISGKEWKEVQEG